MVYATYADVLGRTAGQIPWARIPLHAYLDLHIIRGTVHHRLRIDSFQIGNAARMFAFCNISYYAL